MADVEQRPRFYEGQYLEADDLTAAVEYSRAQLARMAVGAHTWGIALGLDIVEVPGPAGTLDVFVQPGYAWDGFGRAVIVAAPAKIPGLLFSWLDAGFVPGNPPVTVEVWIRFDEENTKGPKPGFETCDPTSAFARVRETFRLEVGPKTLSERRSEIVLAGRVVDAVQALKAFDATAPELADASVPHQDLPATGERRRWLIPLGVVSWTPGNPGSFATRTPVELERTARLRQHCGVVAGSIEATSGHVRVHDRRVPYSTFHTEELLWIEGDVRMDGHARIYGKRLEFVSNHAESPRAPFHVLRRDDLALNSKKLQIVIGEDSGGNNRLAIGPKSGVDASGQDVHQEHLVVTDAGNVGIGTSAPLAPLHIKEEGLQIGTNAVAGNNFHIQSNTDGPRALRFYNGNIGSGTHVASMTQTGRLGVGINDPTNVLHVQGSLGIRQNSIYLSGNENWSSLSFNAHHDSANAAWVFPDPAKPAATIEMDAAGGPPRFEVFSTVLGDNQSWRSRLKVFGHSGDVSMAVGEGGVGIGTHNPLAKLDVRGDVRSTGDLIFANATMRAVGAPSSLKAVWGTVSSGGGILAGEGFTVGTLGNGRYQINFTPPFAGRPAVSVTKIYGDADIDAGTTVKPQQNAILDLLQDNRMIVAMADEAGTGVVSGFSFIALGLR